MDRDKVFSILQSLKDMNLKNSMHKLEEESGVYFNLDYFKEMFMAGHWVDLESYVSSFTKLHESSDVFLEIRRHKHRDAIKRHDEELFRQLFRELFHPAKMFQQENSSERTRVLLERYDDTNAVRTRSLNKLIEDIKGDPILGKKLDFPPLPLPPAVPPLPLPLPLPPVDAVPPLPPVAVIEGRMATRSISRQVSASLAGFDGIPPTARRRRSQRVRVAAAEYDDDAGSAESD